jgi:prophage regulatory protein
LEFALVELTGLYTFQILLATIQSSNRPLYKVIAMTTSKQLRRILRIRDVLSLVGVSRSTLYAWIATGAFPKSVGLGVRSVGWREEAVEAWMLSRH